MYVKVCGLWVCVCVYVSVCTGLCMYIALSVSRSFYFQCVCMLACNMLGGERKLWELALSLYGVGFDD